MNLIDKDDWCEEWEKLLIRRMEMLTTEIGRGGQSIESEE